MPDVRLATIDDVPAALDTLTAAFADYPFTRHTVAADDHVTRIRRFHALFVAEIGLPYGRVWVADGAEAVAVWTTPRTPEHVFAELGPQFAELHGDRAPQATRAERALEPHRPQEPVWFLGSVGVRPDRQGQGLGAAVIRPGLEEAAEVGAYLETSTLDNVAFYRRLGFEVEASVALPDDGPLTWTMRR